jgi:hypothetical protein
MAGPFKMKGPSLYSPMKTKLGRFLMGRKKTTLSGGTEVITDKEGKVVKTKDAEGTSKIQKE